jgi:hypothetical protein
MPSVTLSLSADGLLLIVEEGVISTRLHTKLEIGDGHQSKHSDTNPSGQENKLPIFPVIVVIIIARVAIAHTFDGRFEWLFNAVCVDYVQHQRLEDLVGAIQCPALWDDQLQERGQERGEGEARVRSRYRERDKERERAYIRNSWRILESQDLCVSLLVRASSIIMELHIIFTRVILPKFKR